MRDKYSSTCLKQRVWQRKMIKVSQFYRINYSMAAWPSDMRLWVFFEHFSLFSFRFFNPIFSLSLVSLYPHC